MVSDSNVDQVVLVKNGLVESTQIFPTNFSKNNFASPKYLSHKSNIRYQLDILPFETMFFQALRKNSKKLFCL